VKVILYMLCKAIYQWKIDIRELFETYDQDKSGALKIDEFGKMLRKLDENIPADVIEMIFCYFDV